MTKRGYAAIGCQAILKDANVGGVLRAAQVYSASLVVIGGKFKKLPTDTMKAYRHIPVLQTEDLMAHVPYDCVPVAVDLLEGAESLITFKHPERAYYVFGAENATLGKKISDKCKYRIYVPTKSCMNLAATVNVVLYDRLAKQPTHQPL